MDPYTSNTFSGKWLPGSQETFPWHLIPAPRNYILKNRNQIDLFFRDFPKKQIDMQFEVQSTRDTESTFRLEHSMPWL